MTPEQIAAFMAVSRAARNTRSANDPGMRERNRVDPSLQSRIPGHTSPVGDVSEALYRAGMGGQGLANWGIDSDRLMSAASDVFDPASRALGAAIEGRNPFEAARGAGGMVAGGPGEGYSPADPTLGAALTRSYDVPPLVATLADALVTPDPIGAGRAADLVPVLGLLGPAGLRMMMNSPAGSAIDFLRASDLWDARAHPVLRTPEAQSALRRQFIESGGINEPVTIIVDPNTGRWKVGDGHHRTFAAMEADSPVPTVAMIGHVPDTVGRSLPPEGMEALRNLPGDIRPYDPQMLEPGTPIPPTAFGLPGYTPENVVQYAQRLADDRLVPFTDAELEEITGTLREFASESSPAPRLSNTLTRPTGARSNFSQTIQNAAEAEGFVGEGAEWVQHVIDQLGPQRGLEFVMERTGLTGGELRGTLEQWTKAYDAGRTNMTQIPGSFYDPEFNAAADLGRAELDLGREITGPARDVIENPGVLRWFGQVYDTQGPEEFWRLLRAEGAPDEEIQAIEAALGGPARSTPPPRDPVMDDLVSDRDTLEDAIRDADELKDQVEPMVSWGRIAKWAGDRLKDPDTPDDEILDFLRMAEDLVDGDLTDGLEPSVLADIARDANVDIADLVGDAANIPRIPDVRGASSALLDAEDARFAAQRIDDRRNELADRFGMAYLDDMQAWLVTKGSEPGGATQEDFISYLVDDLGYDEAGATELADIAWNQGMDPSMSPATMREINHSLGPVATDRLAQLESDITEFIAVLNADVMTSRTVAEGDRLYAEISSMLDDLQPLRGANAEADEVIDHLENIRRRIANRVDPADGGGATIKEMSQELGETAHRVVQVEDMLSTIMPDNMTPEELRRVREYGMELDVDVATFENMLNDVSPEVGPDTRRAFEQRLDELRNLRDVFQSQYGRYLDPE